MIPSSWLSNTRNRPPSLGTDHFPGRLLRPRRSYGSTNPYLPFSRMLRSYKTTDPDSKPQLALPIRSIQRAAKFYRGKNTPKGSAISCLLTLAFYFLLQPIEYAMKFSRTSTRMVQFSCSNICFFKNGTVVTQAAPLEELW